jgi:hypothetical protein
MFYLRDTKSPQNLEKKAELWKQRKTKSMKQNDVEETYIEAKRKKFEAN